MGKEYLGEFEELILMLVAALQDDAYGAAIADEIETRLKREVNLSAVHVTLYRLEDKGYIKSNLGGATNERGGRRKRIYTITSAGMAMLRAMKETRIELWKMIPQLKMNY
jgi:PadR family transcriptional regulator PadR